MSIIKNKNQGALALGILVFQGFGLRIFEGIFSGAIVLWLALLLIINRRFIRKVPTAYWFTSIAISLFYLLFNVIKGSSIQTWVVIALLSACVVLTRYYNKRSLFIKDLRKLTKLCMYYDLLHIPVMLFLSQYIVSTDLSMQPKTFMYLFWYNHEVSDFGFNRIQGFCWEPSCWNLLLNINLLLALYFKERKTYLVASIVAVMSTFSTTGMVTMVIILGLYFFMNLKRKNIIRTLISGCVILALLGPFVYNEFIGKMATGSGQTRGGDMAIAYVVMQTRPFMGEDVANIANLSYAMNARADYWTANGDYEGYMDQGLVNSFAGLMVEWGLPIFFFIIILCLRTNLVKGKKLKVLIITTLFLVLFGSPIARTGFFYMFPLSAILLKGTKRDAILTRIKFNSFKDFVATREMMTTDKRRDAADRISCLLQK